MTRRLVPGGLRAQLALAIALVSALAVGASFLALYNGTSSRLRAQIDSQLRTQAAEWRQFTAHADFRTPAALERIATQFIASQRYHAESLIIVVQVSGGRTVSNNSELLAREEARGQSPHETTGLLDSLELVGRDARPAIADGDLESAVAGASRLPASTMTNPFL